MSDFRVARVNQILHQLEVCIVRKRPFSLIRFGDGGIKLLHAYYYNDRKQLELISEKEGLPLDNITKIVQLWARYARGANFIDSPEVYFTDRFWGKYKKNLKLASEKTIKRMQMWKELYGRAKFRNESYCNPEVNYLMCIYRYERRNLLQLMKGLRICCITALPEVQDDLKLFGYNVDIVEIVGHYENHFENSFSKVIKVIEKYARAYDLWLVAAGELGRIYSGLIKAYGGRALDMGFVVDYWHNSEIPARMKNFIEMYPPNRLELMLTSQGCRYDRFI